MWIDAEKVREVLSVENLICLAFLLGISVYDVYSRRISRLALALANILAVSYALAVDERNLAATAAGAAAETPKVSSIALTSSEASRRVISFRASMISSLVSLAISKSFQFPCICTGRAIKYSACAQGCGR